MTDPFASSTVSLVLAWLCVVPLLVWAVGSLVTFLFEKEDLARPFKLWLLICLLLFAPGRYIFFQLVVGATYFVQSWQAFLSSFLLVVYVPLVFGILFAIGIGLPVGLTLLLVGDEAKRTTSRYVAATVALPLACLLATWLFWLALPIGAKSIYWLRPADVIRATNGPAALAFDYVASPGTPMLLPHYFSKTPSDATALRRCHVAAVYLSAGSEGWFVNEAYPAVYEEVMKERGD